MKVSFFDNIYFWARYNAEKKNEAKTAAQPDAVFRAVADERSGSVVAISQYVYFLFFLSLILHTLSDDVVFALYENISPFVLVLPVFGLAAWFFVGGVLIYNNKKYFALKPVYAEFSEAEKAGLKKKYRMYVLVTALVTAAMVWSIVTFANRVERIVSERTEITLPMNRQVLPESEEDRLQRQQIMQSIINQSEE